MMVWTQQCIRCSGRVLAARNWRRAFPAVLSRCPVVLCGRLHVHKRRRLTCLGTALAACGPGQTGRQPRRPLFRQGGMARQAGRLRTLQVWQHACHCLYNCLPQLRCGEAAGSTAERGCERPREHPRQARQPIHHDAHIGGWLIQLHASRPQDHCSRVGGPAPLQGSARPSWPGGSFAGRCHAGWLHQGLPFACLYRAPAAWRAKCVHGVGQGIHLCVLGRRRPTPMHKPRGVHPLSGLPRQALLQGGRRRGRRPPPHRGQPGAGVRNSRAHAGRLSR